MERRLGLAVLTLTLAACAQTPSPEPQTVNAQALTARPAGTPDVVILAASGRCGVPCSSAPAGNHDYLGPQGTTHTIAQSFRDLGYSVEVNNYSSHLEQHYSSISGKQETGFLQMEARFKYIRDNWITGRSNPTRLVLLGHSHGTNWTHNLTRIYPNTTFDYVIDLDGICSLWEDDHASIIQNYYARAGGNPWITDISKSCDNVRITGSWNKLSVKDVAFPNVRYNLEVQSKRVFSGASATVQPQGDSNFAYDYTDNKRPNGTTSGIRTFVSRYESHGQVDDPGSTAMNWVKSQIATLR